MKLQEIKLEDIEKSTLSYEWAGLADGSVLDPKSFSKFTCEQKTVSYLALFSLLSDLDSSNFKLLKNDSSLYSSNTSPFLVLLITAILKIEEHLRHTVHLSYNKHSENTSRIKGKINFKKSTSLNQGLIDKHYCVYKVPERENEFLNFIKVSVNYAYSKISNLGQNKTSLKLSVNNINQVLTKCNGRYNSTETAIKILNRKFDRNIRYRNIAPYVKVLANFFIGRGSDEKKSKYEQNINGVLFNLNRPFESILVNSMLSTDFFCLHSFLNENHAHKTKGFNKVTGFTMKPDCWGVIQSPVLDINKDNKSKKPPFFLMLDAKHKIMTKKIDDLQAGVDKLYNQKVNRSDFYQISTYAYSHKGTHKDAAYALVGLNDEQTPNSEGKYVESSSFININTDTPGFSEDNFSNRSIKIFQISVNFGTLLYDIGSKIQSGESPSEIYKDFGFQILKVLDKDRS